jgi:hypothetical protein
MTGTSIRKTIVHTLRLGLSVSMLLVLLSCTDIPGEYEITRFDLGKGRLIEIFASENAEVSQSFYYQVKVDGKIIVPHVMVCVGHDRGQLKFNTLIAKDGDLVGIFEQKRREQILALHDFRAKATWPGVLSGDQQGEFRMSGGLLLRDLQAEHQNIELRLSSDRSCE